METEFPLLELERRRQARRWQQLRAKVPPALWSRLPFMAALAAIALVVFLFGLDPGLMFFDDETFLWVVIPLIGNTLLLAIFVLVPVFTAGAIAGEVERSSLETLLLTRLSTGKILFEKGVAALRRLLPWGVVLAALLLLRLVSALTGSDFDFNTFLNADLWGFEFVSAALLCVCAGLCLSSYAKTTRTAAVMTFIIVFLITALWYNTVFDLLTDYSYGEALVGHYDAAIDSAMLGLFTLLWHALWSTLCMILAYHRVTYLRNQTAVHGRVIQRVGW
jgi:ABC-type transport system involved in multi-copper enzyme maturation permease subunit